MWEPTPTQHPKRDLRDPAAIGTVILSSLYTGTSILKRCDELLPSFQIKDADPGETSQSEAQRAYRAEHEAKAAQGIKASEDLIAYLDDPDGSQAHPGSLAADVDTRPSRDVASTHAHGNGADSEASSSVNGDSQAKEGE